MLSSVTAPLLRCLPETTVGGGEIGDGSTPRRASSPTTTVQQWDSGTPGTITPEKPSERVGKAYPGCQTFPREVPKSGLHRSHSVGTVTGKLRMCCWGFLWGEATHLLQGMKLRGKVPKRQVTKKSSFIHPYSCFAAVACHEQLWTSNMQREKTTCWTEILYGKAWCLWNCIFAPCVLSFWSCAIYCCGCLRLYAARNGSSTFFKDAKFPANAASVGAEDVVWLRATKYARTKSLQLLDESIDIQRLCQGATGETWLLSAIACVAERRALHHIFETQERNARGKYVLKLFDGTRQWQRIIIDDRVPCNRMAYDDEKRFEPSFLKSQENHLFLLLIEKAFAKVLGGYHRLKEGSTAWALGQMTGDQPRSSRLANGRVGGDGDEGDGLWIFDI
eukprot:symbB.v1.2.003342.t1/scaffold172.1/size290804/8